jgi:hypothetical protein
MHHLEDIEAYEARTLDPETLAATDAHVAGCLACATVLSARSSAPERWERRGLFGRLVRVEPREATIAGAVEAETEEAAAA